MLGHKEADRQRHTSHFPESQQRSTAAAAILSSIQEGAHSPSAYVPHVALPEASFTRTWPLLQAMLLVVVVDGGGLVGAGVGLGLGWGQVKRRRPVMEPSPPVAVPPVLLSPLDLPTATWSPLSTLMPPAQGLRRFRQVCYTQSYPECTSRGVRETRTMYAYMYA